MNIPDDSFESSSVKSVLDDYMRAFFYDGYGGCIVIVDNYGRGITELIGSKGKEFCEALSKISPITVGCEAHDSYHEFIKNFIQKQSGNLESLKAFGFDDEIETRSAEECLKEYVHEFLSSGELIYNANKTMYSLIMEALRNESDRPRRNQMTSTIDITNTILKALGIEMSSSEEENKVEGESEGEIDERLECNYRLAKDDEIAEFYFMQCPYEYHKKNAFLSACIKKMILIEQ